jgi:hypothetical protein
MHIFPLFFPCRDYADIELHLDFSLAAGGDVPPGKKDGGAASTGAHPLDNELRGPGVPEHEFARLLAVLGNFTEIVFEPVELD